MLKIESKRRRNCLLVNLPIIFLFCMYDSDALERSGLNSFQVNPYINTSSVSNDEIFITSDATHQHSRDVVTDSPLQTRLAFIAMYEESSLRLSLLPLESQNLLQIHTDFLIDYAVKREWTSVRFILPENTEKRLEVDICEYLLVTLLLSKASLNVHCSTKEETLKISESVKREGNEVDVTEPTILAGFLDKHQSASCHVGGSFSKVKLIGLLKNYSQNRQILYLSGKETLYDEIECVTTADNLKTLNYKWTVVQSENKAGIFTGNKNEARLSVYNVFGFATSTKPLLQWIGSWSLIDGLELNETNDNGVINFSGHVFRITTVPGPPVVYLHNSSNFLTATGYLPEILEFLSFALNFTYNLLTPADGKFGDVDDQGNWSGMIGMLQNNEADVALMSFSYTRTRRTIMDFSPPVEYSSTRLLIKRDWRSIELKWDAYVRPFHLHVWLSMVILIGWGSLTLTIFAKLLPLGLTPFESVWLVSTCFVNQSQSLHSSIGRIPFRVVVGTFWILSVITLASYNARLISFLAAGTDKMPVNDLSEAVKSSSWKIGLVKGSSFLERVKESDKEEMRFLWKRIQMDSSLLVNGFSEGISKVYQERYIFFTSELIPSFLVKGNCSFGWLPGKYFPGFGYLGYQKHLPYESSISRMLQKTREVGLMNRAFKKWWGSASSCTAGTSVVAAASNNIFPAVSLHEVGSALIMLTMGASLALLFFSFEFFCLYFNF